MNTKRVVIATVLGVIAGLVCWRLSSSTGPLPWFLVLSIILGRTLIGFTIGISIMRITWWVHGVVIGFIYSLPAAFMNFYTPQEPTSIFLWTLIMGIVYGFFIELITTVVFKAKA